MLITLAGDNVGTIHLLDRHHLLIGRDDDADIKLDDVGVSRRHAGLRWDDDKKAFAIVDLRSSNGTWVNGAQVADRLLKPGDKIRLGKNTVFRVSHANELEVQFAQTMNAAALRDPMTNTFNRRYITHRLASEAAFARRHRTELTVLMADIDHFKNVNDSFGHTVGDQVLCEFVNVVQRMLRSEDIMGRYGGEEFVVICRDIDVLEASVVATRIRTAIEEHPFEVDGASIRVTVSIGVSAFDQDLLDPDRLLEAADDALYAAKSGGRNRVVRHDELP